MLRFYVASRGGITGRLAKSAPKRHSYPVLLEGPYGGVKGQPLHSYDRSLIVACGSGAGFSLPFIMSQLLRSRAGTAPGHRMHVVISARETVDWYEEALMDFIEENNLPATLEGIEISIHITGNSDVSLPGSGDDEKRIDGGVVEHQHGSRKLPIRTLRGRPALRSIVNELVGEAGVSVGMAVCGPASVTHLVQDEAAKAQRRILSGGGGAREVYLHSELFSW